MLLHGDYLCQNSQHEINTTSLLTLFLLWSEYPLKCCQGFCSCCAKMKVHNKDILVSVRDDKALICPPVDKLWYTQSIPELCEQWGCRRSLYVFVDVGIKQVYQWNYWASQMWHQKKHPVADFCPSGFPSPLRFVALIAPHTATLPLLCSFLIMFSSWGKVHWAFPTHLAMDLKLRRLALVFEQF